MRPDGSGVARDILESSVNLALEADGSLHARIIFFPGDVRVVDLRTAPLGLLDGPPLAPCAANHIDDEPRRRAAHAARPGD